MDRAEAVKLIVAYKDKVRADAVFKDIEKVRLGYGFLIMNFKDREQGINLTEIAEYILS